MVIARFAIFSLPGLLVLGSGCSALAPAAGVEETDVGVAASAVTESCKFYNYHHDEGTNPGGSNRCSNDCDCDGMRTCSQWGWCQGDARPPVSCTSPSYYWNEAWNSGGSNRCSSDCECDGQRTCSQWGWCQGTSR